MAAQTYVIIYPNPYPNPNPNPKVNVGKNTKELDAKT